MTDLDRLLAAIIANPDDDAVRLVYADKLQDLDTEEARARAEFIRLQVSLAADGFDDTVSCNKDCKCGGRGTKAFKLLETYATLWEPKEVADCRDVQFVWHRGFIREVRAPLAALVGGECGRCRGDGRTGTLIGDPECATCDGHGRVEDPDSEYRDGTMDCPDCDRVQCPACHGTSRTPGVLPAIAQAHPLEWVRATDAIHEDGRFPGGHCIRREQFPRELWLGLISRVGGIDANTITATREELEELLSRALIAWARKEQTCTT